jgi:hypothetical protein
MAKSAVISAQSTVGGRAWTFWEAPAVTSASGPCAIRCTCELEIDFRQFRRRDVSSPSGASLTRSSPGHPGAKIVMHAELHYF